MRFKILDYFYLTKKLNIISLVNQKYYKANFLILFSKNIFLYIMTRKITIGNKITVNYNYKKSCAMQLKYKYQKNNIKYL